ncbi:MAG: GAF domain-containing protein, partial [Anaerolineales bacterium]|nr:GAF domain-containing protein [Anaerolineales bacterium]
KFATSHDNWFNMLQTDKSSLDATSDSIELKTLYAVTRMLNQISSNGNMGDLLPDVLSLTMLAVGGVEGSLFLVDNNLSLKHAWLVENGKLVDGDRLFLNIIISEGLAGLALKERQSVVVDNTTADRRWMAQRGHSATTSPWSAISLPLTMYDDVKGVLTIARPGAGQFTEENQELLTLIADQIAVVLSNADLQQMKSRNADDLASLVTAAAAISSTLDTQQIYHVVAEQMAIFANVDACAVLVYNTQEQKFSGRALHSQSNELRLSDTDISTLLKTNFIRNIFDAPRPMQINMEDAELSSELYDLLSRSNLKSILALPLTAQNQSIGVAVLIDRERIRTFGDVEISLLRTLGTQAAIAVQNARLYTETQRQLSVTNLLNESSQVINSSLDIEQIMKSLLSQMNEFLRSEAVSIALLDKGSQELVFTVAEGIGSDEIVGMRMPSHQGVAGWVLQHNTPALVNDTSQDPRHHQQGDERTGHPTKAMICAPITVKGKVLGTIQAINPIEKNSFTENELDVVMNLANLASSAMNNAQQYTKAQAAESRYMGLFQDSIDPIILTDKIGNILEVNSRACELLEYDRRELIRLRINNLHPVETGLLGERSFQPIQARQIKMFTSEIITKNRRRTPVEVYAKRIYMGENQILQWIYHDITEQVELEQMREDLTAMLFHDL